MAHAHTSWWRRIEAPTWAVSVAVYGGWAAVTAGWSELPLWALPLLGGWLVAWHGSLQHEAIHGHPTRWPAVNAALAGVPLGLWLPYPLYRESHLRHHRAAGALTEPGVDPESYYVTPAAWARLGAPGRAALWAHQTLLGRLLLGPPLAVGRLVTAELARLRAGDRSHLAAWAVHGLLVAGVLAWVVGVCGLPLWGYLLAFVYPGLALTLLRSFAEHTPALEPAERTRVVEAEAPLALVFLNNNLHVLHHDAPGVPWYELPARYRAEREDVEARHGPPLPGYLSLAWRYLLRPKDAPVHPRIPEGVGARSAA